MRLAFSYYFTQSHVLLVFIIMHTSVCYGQKGTNKIIVIECCSAVGSFTHLFESTEISSFSSLRSSLIIILTGFKYGFVFGAF